MMDWRVFQLKSGWVLDAPLIATADKPEAIEFIQSRPAFRP
jgi:hypothetical protein